MEDFGQLLEDPPPFVERRRNNTNIGLMLAMAGLAITFLVQFGGSIWWGATLSADVRHVNETLARMEGERYTKQDATRDILRLDQRDATIAEQVNELRQRVTRAEERIDGRGSK